MTTEPAPTKSIRVFRGDLPGYFCVLDEDSPRDPCASDRCPIRSAQSDGSGGAEMRWLDHLWRKNQEWDDRTGSYVRKGWIAERQALDDAEMERWRQRVTEGHLDYGSKCLACGLLIDLHPHPARMYRSGPDLCAAAREAALNDGSPAGSVTGVTAPEPPGLAGAAPDPAGDHSDGSESR